MRLWTGTLVVAMRCYEICLFSQAILRLCRYIKSDMITSCPRSKIGNFAAQVLVTRARTGITEAKDPQRGYEPVAMRRSAERGMLDAGATIL